MRENYRLVSDGGDVPANSALIRLWHDCGRPVGDVRAGDEMLLPHTDADIVLFWASLALHQQDRDGLCVWLEEPGLWQEEWGNLARY